MSDVVARILRERRRERILSSHAGRGRMIPRETYKVLKRVVKCEVCGRKRKGKPFEIHHKQPVSLGGSNERVNLLALCRKCHVKAHKKGGGAV